MSFFLACSGMIAAVGSAPPASTGGAILNEGFISGDARSFKQSDITISLYSDSPTVLVATFPVISQTHDVTK
jgi:hypothetical protein